jgi:hypothetical protein
MMYAPMPAARSRIHVVTPPTLRWRLAVRPLAGS